MTNSSDSEQNSEKAKDNFERERKASLGFISQLVRFAPTGGSLWIFGSFIKDQDWLNAVITFPLMVIMVAWSAYSEGFLLKIQERMGEEGQKNAESLIEQLQKLNRAIQESIKWQLAGTDEKYLKCQGSSCSDYETIGYNQASGTFMPLLKDVFVPLELSDIFIKDCTGEEFPGLPGYSEGRGQKGNRRQTQRSPSCQRNRYAFTVSGKSTATTSDRTGSNAGSPRTTNQCRRFNPIS